MLQRYYQKTLLIGSFSLLISSISLNFWANIKDIIKILKIFHFHYFWMKLMDLCFILQITIQTGATASESNPAINVHFTISQLAVSGLKVNGLDMYGEKYKPFKGVKYITKAGRFQIRMWNPNIPWNNSTEQIIQWKCNKKQFLWTIWFCVISIFLINRNIRLKILLLM